MTNESRGTSFAAKITDALTIHLKDAAGDALIAAGTSVPTDTSLFSYAKGCLFIKTDAGSGTKALYENQGTVASPSFNLIGDISTSEIADSAVTNAKISVPKLVTYQQTVAFDDFTDNEDTTGTLELSTTIPEGAVYAYTLIDAVTGFAGDTSAVITVGDGTDADRYNTGTPDVFSDVDHLSAGAPSGTVYHSAAKTPTLIVTTNADFTSVSAGQLTITLFYYQGV